MCAGSYINSSKPCAAVGRAGGLKKGLSAIALILSNASFVLVKQALNCRIQPFARFIHKFVQCQWVELGRSSPGTA
jgi:hypothetical protein